MAEQPCDYANNQWTNHFRWNVMICELYFNENLLILLPLREESDKALHCVEFHRITSLFCDHFLQVFE
jgi:hypothetical protein